ncbi:hypothetical protein ACFL59_14870, partial [Planctomycetota bacterium]
AERADLQGMWEWLLAVGRSESSRGFVRSRAACPDGDSAPGIVILQPWLHCMELVPDEKEPRLRWAFRSSLGHGCRGSASSLAALHSGLTPCMLRQLLDAWRTGLLARAVAEAPRL